jgi:hypothetical protein
MKVSIENGILDCSGCRRYTEVPLDIMDFVRTDSPLARAADKFPVYSRLGRGAKRGVSSLELAKSKN